MQSWLSILLLFAVAVGFGAFTVFISQLLGPKVVTPEKLAPYECGVPPVGDARERQSVKFYLVAMVFLPLTFITGLLGMNVAGIPFAHEQWAFWGVVTVCGLLGLAVAGLSPSERRVRGF